MHEKYLDICNSLALSNAKNGFTNGGPFGAIIVKNGKIIAKEKNSVIKSHDATCHAEMNAIRKASKRLKTFNLKGCILYTNCYPCPMCLSAAIWAGIKNIYYFKTAKDAKEIGFLDDDIYDFIKGNSNIVSLNKIKIKDSNDAFNIYKQNEKNQY